MAALGPRLQFARQRTRRTMTPVPSAALIVASASSAPGRGSLSGTPARWQVMQTYTVAASVAVAVSDMRVASAAATRDAPQDVCCDSGARRQPTGAEAPRPARDRINGRSPGSRVAARHRLPGYFQWLSGADSPLTVAGAAVALEPRFLTTFPVRSLVRDRRCRT